MIKLLKKILTVSLIFALSFPTFSAVSVSDGSSFVSKAEFDAYKTDTNIFMTNLENSLDSKIESLVTTYLSTNGIWNGATQVITEAKKTTTVSFSGIVFSTSTKRVNGISHYTQVATNVFTIDKSGLLFLNVSLSGTSDYNEIIIKGYNFSSGHIDDALTGVFMLGFYTSSIGAKDDFISTISASSGYSDHTGNIITTASLDRSIWLPAPWGNHVLMGFVNKNDQVNFGTGISVFASWWPCYFAIRQAEGGMNVKINSAVVY